MDDEDFISKEAFRRKVVHYFTHSGLFVPNKCDAHGVEVGHKKSTRNWKNLKNTIKTVGRMRAALKGFSKK